MANNADSTLITCILKEESLTASDRRIATMLSVLRPEGSFSIVHVKDEKRNRLCFKYRTFSRSKVEVKLSFLINLDRQGEALYFHPMRCGVVGSDRTFSTDSDRNLNYMRLARIRGRYLDIDEDVELTFDDFESHFKWFEASLISEVITTDRTAKRQAAANVVKQSKLQSEIQALRHTLFLEMNLVGNERANRLFDYLTRFHGSKFKGVEKQFREMAFIVK